MAARSIRFMKFLTNAGRSGAAQSLIRYSNVNTEMHRYSRRRKILVALSFSNCSILSRQKVVEEITINIRMVIDKPKAKEELSGSLNRVHMIGRNCSTWLTFKMLFKVGELWSLVRLASNARFSEILSSIFPIVILRFKAVNAGDPLDCSPFFGVSITPTCRSCVHCSTFSFGNLERITAKPCNLYHIFWLGSVSSRPTLSIAVLLDRRLRSDLLSIDFFRSGGASV
mmetsp:Transcript_12093/g.25411  ORF Transcript_12093/g.25411 Transcript_12093/m.25411 type:complete len:227 (+) Transcript_12093:1337-2017(+)